MRYEITQDNVVNVYNDALIDNAGTPIISQPCWPDRTPWSAEEAAAWGAQYVLAATNPSNDLPPTSPGGPTIKQKTPEELEAEAANLTIAMPRGQFEQLVAERVAEALAAAGVAPAE